MLKEKNCYFVCLLRKTVYLCNRCIKKKEMRVTNLNNLSILHIIRVVVVTSRGEKGYAC